MDNYKYQYREEGNSMKNFIPTGFGQKPTKGSGFGRGTFINATTRN